MTDLLDLNTLLAIWTGSAVPIIITFLGYYLVRRSEDRRHVLEEKKRVYSELSWGIRTVAQNLSDLRALQTLKPEKGDAKELQALGVKVTSLNSMWLADGALDFLRDELEAGFDGSDQGRVSKGRAKESFEAFKARIMFELQAHLLKNANRMARYASELQRFKLAKPIQDNLSIVWQLFNEMSQNTTASGLLSMTDLSSLDTGADLGPWAEKMQKALNALTKALNDDLASNR